MKIEESINSTRIGTYEPGNGTRYQVIAVPWRYEGCLGALGYVANGWLVVNCLNGLAYLFQKSAYLIDDYIQEKLGGFEGDYPYLGDLVREVLERR